MIPYRRTGALVSRSGICASAALSVRSTQGGFCCPKSQTLGDFVVVVIPISGKLPLAGIFEAGLGFQLSAILRPAQTGTRWW